LMNGDIGVESAEGKGSVFWFTAIFDKAKEDSEIDKDNIDLDDYDLGVKLKVLMAEDNEVIQRVAAFSFEKMGCVLDIVNNGKEAVEHFKENKYDIVFTDIQMPELDGIDATKQIREYENEIGSLHHIPIVAMTANTMKGDRERFLEVGMDDYISKPFKPEQLYKLLKRMLKLFIVKD
ncbi:response regulator, partial [Bacteroidota bacterium]